MRTNALPLLLVLAAAAAAACGQDRPRGDPLKGGAPPETTAPELPSGHPPIGQLPPGHPPMGAGAGAQPGAPAPAAGLPTDTTAAPFTWTVPPGWKELGGQGMRLTQFELPGKLPDGSPVIAVLFTRMGGGVEGNVARWKGQVQGAGEGEVTTSDVDGFKVTRLEKRGTYSGMGGAGASDAVFLGAVIDVGQGDQVFTVRLFGPPSVIDAEEKNFDAFLASLKKR